jgi:hypothetical protein
MIAREKSEVSMLIAIVLTLTSPTDATLPAHLGRANYAATLAALQRLDPALGPALHDGEGIKPLTCSGLLTGAGDHDQIRLRAGATCYVRMTGLTPLASEALAAALSALRFAASLALLMTWFSFCCRWCRQSGQRWLSPLHIVRCE